MREKKKENSIESKLRGRLNRVIIFHRRLTGSCFVVLKKEVGSNSQRGSSELRRTDLDFEKYYWSLGFIERVPTHTLRRGTRE